MHAWLRSLGTWFDRRLAFSEVSAADAAPPVPRAIDGRWAGGMCSAAPSMTLLGIQILSGIGLALVYVPSADEAYESLLFLDYEQPLGWFLRALHYYAGSGMVVMVLAHMTQVSCTERTSIRAS